MLQRLSTHGRFRVPLVQDPRGEREAEGRVEDEWLGRRRGVGGREEVGYMREESMCCCNVNDVWAVYFVGAGRRGRGCGRR